MKKLLSTLLQALLFFIVFVVGTFLHPFNLRWGLTFTTPSITRYFVPDGLLLTLALFIAIVITQAIRKRLCNTTWTIIAFMVAVVAAYALRLGFVTHEL
ncbi:MAG TPA: hypothetical protein VK608_02015 [Edaphobacter sp.]|nr:hypothetical protein [Edaphobacter sp.]